MFKKILKTFFIILVVMTIGLGIYWFFDRNQTEGEPFGGSDGLSIGDFFPFGNSGNNTQTPEPGNTDEPNTPSQQNPVIPTEPAKLWQISSEPQAGAIMFYASSTPYVRFVDRATGNVYEAILNLLGLKRISNTTIPKVYEAAWLPGGKSVILRYLDNDYQRIQTAVGTLIPPKNSATTTPEGSFQELKVSFLSDSIDNLSVNGTTGAIAYMNRFFDRSAVYVANTATATPRQIYSTPIHDLTVSVINNTDIGLLTNPNADTAGQFYILKRDSGAMTRGLGGIVGLSALASPNSQRIAYSESTGDSFALSVFIVTNGQTIATSFKTLAEKCVWSKSSTYLYCATPKSIPSAKYPDDWYKGRVSFDDSVWRIDTSTGATEFLANTATAAEGGIDAINLTLDPTENYLIFTNKKDSQLWGLRLTTGS